MKENYYYSKYLKYKMKYLREKEMQIGGKPMSILFKIGLDFIKLEIDSENTVDEVKDIISNTLFLNKDRLTLNKNLNIPLNFPSHKISDIITEGDYLSTLGLYNKVEIRGNEIFNIYIHISDTVEDIKNIINKKLRKNNLDSIKLYITVNEVSQLLNQDYLVLLRNAHYEITRIVILIEL
jgi:hypothetical protein